MLIFSLRFCFDGISAAFIYRHCVINIILSTNTLINFEIFLTTNIKWCIILYKIIDWEEMQMDLDDISQQYDSLKPSLEELEKEARFILENGLKAKHIKYHSISSRIKDFNSFSAKRARIESNDPFEEINDLVGIRVICLFKSDLPLIKNIILESFKLISEDDKIANDDISSFGYMSIHYIVQINEGCSGPRYNNIKGKNVEIQVRTILMDAWANVSHYLDYKNDNAVPKNLKKDFYALSGLFYIADTHFQLFYNASKDSNKAMSKSFRQTKPNLNIEINFDSLTEYLKTRFPDRMQADSNSLSKLATEMSEGGYLSISQIDKAINFAYDTFLDVEKEKPAKANGWKFRYGVVGVVRYIMRLVNDKYYQSWCKYGIKERVATVRKYREILKSSR